MHDRGRAVLLVSLVDHLHHWCRCFFTFLSKLNEFQAEVSKDFSKLEPEIKVGRESSIWHSSNLPLYFYQQTQFRAVKGYLKAPQLTSHFVSSVIGSRQYQLSTNQFYFSLLLSLFFASGNEILFGWGWALWNLHDLFQVRREWHWSGHKHFQSTGDHTKKLDAEWLLHRNAEQWTFVSLLIPIRGMQENGSTSRYCAPSIISLNASYFSTWFCSFHWEIQLTNFH